MREAIGNTGQEEKEESKATGKLSFSTSYFWIWGVMRNGGYVEFPTYND